MSYWLDFNLDIYGWQQDAFAIRIDYCKCNLSSVRSPIYFFDGTACIFIDYATI